MKKSLAGALLVLSVIAVVAIVRAQDKKEPEHKLIEFHMALLKRGPNYNAAGMPKDLRSGHIASVMSLLESGRLSSPDRWGTMATSPALSSSAPSQRRRPA